MSSDKNSSHSSLPNIPQIRLLSRLFKKIPIISMWAVGMLGRLSRRMKSSTTIVALVAAAVLVGHTVSAQVNQPLPLSKVAVPEPSNIGDFIRDKTAAIALGKSLFWDMQLGSDGIQSCASCHFHAGADNRSKNQLNPGGRGGDTDFNIGGRPNYQLTAADYPFHKLADPNNIASNVVSDSNDVTGSQGVFRSDFVDVARPASDKDIVTPKKDDVFNVQATNVRQVTDRNSPTVINAVFNFRNFWDGRAQDVFNGVNPFGLRDANAFVLKATKVRRLEDVRVALKNSSLASQAVGPPLSAFETAAENLPIAPALVQLSDADNTVSVSEPKNGRTISSDTADLAPLTDEASNANNENATNTADSSTRQPTPLKRIGRKLGKKLLALKPLAKQNVAADDSVLATYRAPDKGLKTTYKAMIEAAFKPEWWNSDLVIRVDPKTGDRRFFRKPRNLPLNRLGTNVYSLAEYNFSLFFGLAVQAYESTLISAQTPFDQFLANNTNALTEQQKQGWQLFQSKGCIGCHGGTELTTASASNVASRGRITRFPPQFGNFPQDTGFFSIGVRPPQEDLGVGGNDNVGELEKPAQPANDNPLSEVRLAQQGKFQQIFGEAPPALNPPLNSSETIVADGAFKTPGLRNIELTAPYFHNGGQSTLEQVVDFYSRGGDFGGLPVLNLTPAEKQALVAFLNSLTDERVRYQQAPFDHPQLFVPNGHPGDQNLVTVDPNVRTSDGTQQATDALLEIPAVGRKGGNPLPNFLATSTKG